MGWKRFPWGGTVLVLLFLLFLAALPLYAATVYGEDQVVIGPDEVVPDDVYVFGSSVLIQGRVEGDVYAFSRKLRIEGEVTGDVVAAAQIIDITGRVEDDVRVAGAVIRVAGAGVGDDLLAAGASVEVGRDTPIGGDVIAAAYQVLCAGDVQGNVNIGANAVELHGSIQGDARIATGEKQQGPSPLVFLPSDDVGVPRVQPGLTVGEDVRIRGNLTYHSVQPARIAAGAQIQGEVQHILPQPTRRPEREERRFGSPAWVREQVRRYVSFLFVGVLLFLLFPQGMRRLGGILRRRPASALGWGVVLFLGLLAVLFGLLFVAVLLALLFKVLTLHLLSTWSFLLGVFGDMLLIVGYYVYVTFVVPVLVPYGVLSRLDRGGFWWVIPLVVGVFLYVLLTGLPYVGWLLNVLFILAGLGVWVVWWRRRNDEPNA